jgi:hypothetical protein
MDCEFINIWKLTVYPFLIVVGFTVIISTSLEGMLVLSSITLLAVSTVLTQFLPFVVVEKPLEERGVHR